MYVLVQSLTEHENQRDNLFLFQFDRITCVHCARVRIRFFLFSVYFFLHSIRLARIQIKIMLSIFAGVSPIADTRQHRISNEL